MKSKLAIWLTLTLSACGGGGSGGTALAPGPAAVNFGAAFASLINNGLSVNVSLSGSVQGNAISGTGTYALAPSVSAPFDNGAAALSQALSATFNVTAGGQTITVTSSVTDYYQTGSYAFLGEQDNNPPPPLEFDIALPPLTYPSMVKFGDTAVLGTVMRYQDNTKSSAAGTATVSYLVKAGAANSDTLIVELINQIYDVNNMLVQTDKTDYAVTASGAISFVSATAQEGADSLVVTAN